MIGWPWSCLQLRKNLESEMKGSSLWPQRTKETNRDRWGVVGSQCHLITPMFLRHSCWKIRCYIICLGLTDHLHLLEYWWKNGVIKHWSNKCINSHFSVSLDPQHDFMSLKLFPRFPHLPPLRASYSRPSRIRGATRGIHGRTEDLWENLF